MTDENLARRLGNRIQALEKENMRLRRELDHERDRAMQTRQQLYETQAKVERITALNERNTGDLMKYDDLITELFDLIKPFTGEYEG